jgi:hypothetical protein
LKNPHLDKNTEGYMKYKNQSNIYTIPYVLSKKTTKPFQTCLYLSFLVQTIDNQNSTTDSILKYSNSAFGMKWYLSRAIEIALSMSPKCSYAELLDLNILFILTHIPFILIKN